MLHIDHLEATVAALQNTQGGYGSGDTIIYRSGEVEPIVVDPPPVIDPVIVSTTSVNKIQPSPTNAPLMYLETTNIYSDDRVEVTSARNFTYTRYVGALLTDVVDG